MSPQQSARNCRKTFVLDSSSIITISDNCLIKIFKNISEREGIDFCIPESVYAESVLRPLKINRYELNAMRIRDAVAEGYIKVVETTPGMARRLARLEEAAAGLCTFNGEKMPLLQAGEMETLALIKEIGADALVIDERTTRMVLEEPQNMFGFLKNRHPGGKIVLSEGRLREIREEYYDTKIFRSTELIALAYEDGSFGSELRTSKESLEAALYAAKYSGCAVSSDEIIAYLKMVK